MYAPIIISPYWSKSFDVMYDACGVALGQVLGQRRDKILHSIYYTRKTLNKAQKKYIMIEQELFAVVFVFTTFHSYLFGTRVIVHTDNSVLWYLMAKKDVNP